jgi:hypothetical protein
MKNLQDFLASPGFAELLGFVLSGAGVTFIAQWLKKMGKLESEKVIQFVVIALSVASAILQYTISNSNESMTVLGINTATIVGVAQALYLYLLKPISNFVDKVNMQYEQNLKAITAKQPLEQQPVATLAAETTQPQSPSEFNL